MIHYPFLAGFLLGFAVAAAWFIGMFFVLGLFLKPRRVMPRDRAALSNFDPFE